MFAVQINFSGKSNPSEAVFLPRSSATIGTSDHNHLVIEGLNDIGVEVNLIRGLGSRFLVRIVSANNTTESLLSERLISEKEYLSFSDLKIGELEIFIYSFDPLVFSDGSDCDNLQFLNNIFNSSDSLFPALQVVSKPKVGFTLSDINRLKIGRSSICELRLGEDVELEHVELNKNDTDHWMISPLISSSPTLVNGSLINSQNILRSRDRIRIGQTELIYVDSISDFNEFSEEIGYSISDSYDAAGYTLSVIKGVASPKSIPLRVGGTYTVGRDPSHSMWIDAPFVSRLHFTIGILSEGLEITDFSSNGTIVSETKLIPEKPSFFNSDQTEIILGPEFTLRITKQVRDYKSLPDSMIIEDSIISSKEVVEDNIQVVGRDLNIRTVSDESISNLSSLEDNFYDSEPRGELPIRVGLERFSTQIFVTVLLLVLLGVIIFVAKNIVL